ncbi:unnamed protein product [Paramecium sonneborni]|uniref:Uncharacterized protein n=1 Tax=Paramecium sonneborni TaxID=65129 RepID=A0A8S1PRT3_9CILI|nr:unnamed protein product [Paramecium sonneborni]
MQINKAYLESPFILYETINDVQEKSSDNFQQSEVDNKQLRQVDQLRNQGQLQIYDQQNQPYQSLNYNQEQNFFSSTKFLQQNEEESKNNQLQYHELQIFNQLDHDYEQQINLQEEYDEQHQQDHPINLRNQMSQENRDFNHKQVTQLELEEFGRIIEVGLSQIQKEEELINDKFNHISSKSQNLYIISDIFCSNTKIKFKINNLYIRNEKVLKDIFKKIHKMKVKLDSVDCVQFNQELKNYCQQHEIILILSGHQEQIFNFYYVNAQQSIKFAFSLINIFNNQDLYEFEGKQDIIELGNNIIESILMLQEQQAGKQMHINFDMINNLILVCVRWMNQIYYQQLNNNNRLCLCQNENSSCDVINEQTTFQDNLGSNLENQYFCYLKYYLEINYDLAVVLFKLIFGDDKSLIIQDKNLTRRRLSRFFNKIIKLAQSQTIIEVGQVLKLQKEQKPKVFQNMIKIRNEHKKIQKRQSQE